MSLAEEDRHLVEKQPPRPAPGGERSAALRLRSLVWKEGEPLGSQLRLAWALYFALVAIVVVLSQAT